MNATSDLSPAAEVIANNLDLLAQILLCLPAKTIIRFKFVSKHWLSLLSDSQFAAKHSIRNPNPSISGLFLYWNYKVDPKSVSLNGDPNRVPTLDFIKGVGNFRLRAEIIDSCNGLLLCEYSRRYPNFYSPCHYLVCNPTTQTYTLIPQPAEFTPRALLRVFLAFDPSKSPHYKVVFMGPDPDLYSPYLKIYIYCSESASWRQIHARPGTGFKLGVFCGGVIYWLSDDNVVLGFDVDLEKMIEMPKPPGILSLDKIVYFGACGGSLFLIQTHELIDKGFRILEVDTEYCRWIVKGPADLGPLQCVYSQLGYKYGDRYSVLCVLKGEKEEDFALVFSVAGKVLGLHVAVKKCGGEEWKNWPLRLFQLDWNY
ncbi:hypothetical protein RHSIM_Rhsim01G0016800 [Rhododendron simsii]|uniref:F-box protein n=1 Tax=Rhododendron simsii TaxID=118357 RepID=A0A834HD75_RHOSS|nr:hypothetical protein RHSIM_Rhsim01G0016800 [Rhododendron simsii]